MSCHPITAAHSFGQAELLCRMSKIRNRCEKNRRDFFDLCFCSKNGKITYEHFCQISQSLHKILVKFDAIYEIRNETMQMIRFYRKEKRRLLTSRLMEQYDANQIVKIHLLEQKALTELEAIDIKYSYITAKFWHKMMVLKANGFKVTGAFCSLEQF